MGVTTQGFGAPDQRGGGVEGRELSISRQNYIASLPSKEKYYGGMAHSQKLKSTSRSINY